MRKDHNLHVVWGVTLVAVLGTSSVTPAFPRIVQELGISPGQVVLLITYLPILMNEFFRASPFVIGVAVASSSLTTALTSTQIERLSSRLSEKSLICFPSSSTPWRSASSPSPRPWFSGLPRASTCQTPSRS